MSKLVEANEKIAEAVVGGYKKIEDGVVSGYQKIEKGAVDGFNKVADKCVEKLFAKEGESVEDAKVKRPTTVFAYIFGSISAVIMGSGMSLVMTDIGSEIGIERAMVSGIVIGMVGMLMAILNYPIHKKMLTSRKKKYAKQIIELSEKIC